MSSFSGYPASLRFVFNRLVSYSRNRVKQPIVGPQSASNGDTVIYEIPAGVKIDLSTLSFHGTVTTTATGGTTPSCVIPRFTNCLIQQMQVDANGCTLYSLDNYCHAYHLMMSVGGGDLAEFRGSVNGEFGRNYTATTNSTVMSALPIVMKNFLGPLGSNKVIDTNLTGPIRVSMRLVPKEALITVGSPTSITFKMESMFISYDTIQINDDMYDRMMMQRLQSGNTIPWVFNNYKSFLGSTGSTDGLTNRVPVNTTSLDYIIHTVLPSDYSGSAGNAFHLGSSYYMKKGVAGITGAQFQLGSTYIPQYRPMAPIELISHTFDSLGISGDMNGTSVTEFGNASATNTAGLTGNVLQDIYINSFFMYAVKLCHGSDPGEFAGRTLSGIDTTGSSVLLSCQTFGGSNNAVPLTILCQSSILNIGAGRQLQLIE